MPVLIVHTRAQENLRVPFDGDDLRVGRSHENDICLSEDLSTSRFHARFFSLNGKFFVQDVGSTHGTTVNGWRVDDQAELHPGDEILIGQTAIRFSFQMEEPEATLPTGQADEVTDLPGGLAGDTVVVPLSQTIHSIQDHGFGAAAPRTGGDSVSGRAFAVLSRAARKLLADQSIPEVLDMFLEMVFDVARPDRGAIMLLEGSPPVLKTRARRGLSGRDDGELPVSRTIADLCLRKQQAILTRDAALDDRLAGSESVVLQGIRSAMSVPLWNNEEVLGLIYVDSPGDSRFGKEDLEVVALLGNLAAVKIENLRLRERDRKMQLLEQELSAATRIQRRLLPTVLPELESYALDGFNVACKEVGGDYFDFRLRPGGNLALAIGDVSGKGMGAALLMATLQAAFRAHVGTEAPAEDIVPRINREICDNCSAGRFITFFYGELEPATGRMVYTNAGHNPPLLLRRDGRAEDLPSSGMILGFRQDATYAARQVTMEPGDLLVCYSDGITEARSPEGEELEEEGLLQAVLPVRGGSLDAVRSAVVDAVERFTAGAPREDDITLSLLRRG